MQNAMKHAGYLIHIVARDLKRHFDSESQTLDLTLPQWRALVHLSRSDGISQTALANLCETDAVTIGGVIERLETKGLVQRLLNPEDSRVKIVRLSEKADGLVLCMNALADKIFSEVFEGVSDADRDTAIRVLEQMRLNLLNFRMS